MSHHRGTLGDVFRKFYRFSCLNLPRGRRNRWLAHCVSPPPQRPFWTERPRTWAGTMNASTPPLRDSNDDIGSVYAAATAEMAESDTLLGWTVNVGGLLCSTRHCSHSTLLAAGARMRNGRPSKRSVAGSRSVAETVSTVEALTMRVGGQFCVSWSR
jgi:hypothetical protein